MSTALKKVTKEKGSSEKASCALGLQAHFGIETKGAAEVCRSRANGQINSDDYQIRHGQLLATSDLDLLFT